MVRGFAHVVAMQSNPAAQSPGDEHGAPSLNSGSHVPNVDAQVSPGSQGAVTPSQVAPSAPEGVATHTKLAPPHEAPAAQAPYAPVKHGSPTLPTAAQVPHALELAVPAIWVIPPGHTQFAHPAPPMH